MTGLAEGYRAARREHPLLRASDCIAIARHKRVDYGWERQRGSGDRWTKDVEGFTLVLKVEDESIYPKEGDCLGHYVEEVRGYGYGDWDGNYPEPSEEFPLGLPYTSFRWTGVNQGDGGYFVPDGIEEFFDARRHGGQSKSVAWDLTKAWVEDTLTSFFSDPLVYLHVWVSAYREGIKLGTDSMGTSVCDDPDYVFDMVEEHGMVDTAIEQARDAITRLTTQPTATEKERA